MVVSDVLMFDSMRPLTRARFNYLLFFVFFFFGHLRQNQNYSFDSNPHLFEMVDLTLSAHIFIHNHNRDNLRDTNIDEDKTNVLESIERMQKIKEI